MLRRFGCKVGQGYLFSRPLPADQVGGLFLGDGTELRLSSRLTGCVGSRIWT